jgi:hypothetical protein
LAINLTLPALIRVQECKRIESRTMVRQLPKRRLVMERAIRGHVRKAASIRAREPGLHEEERALPPRSNSADAQ